MWWFWSGLGSWWGVFLVRLFDKSGKSMLEKLKNPLVKRGICSCSFWTPSSTSYKAFPCFRYAIHLSYTLPEFSKFPDLALLIFLCSLRKAIMCSFVRIEVQQRSPHDIEPSIRHLQVNAPPIRPKSLQS